MKVFRSSIETLFRVCVAGALFLVLHCFLWFLQFCISLETYPNFDNQDYNRIAQGIKEYREEHGTTPFSLLEISEELDRSYGSEFFIIPIWAPDWHEQGVWIMSRRPLRMLLPFPFGVLNNRFEIKDKNDFPVTCRSMPDWETRRLCSWVAGQEGLTKQDIPKYNLTLSFVPDVLFYLVLVALTALFVRRASRIDKWENEQLKSLSGLYPGIHDFHLKNRRLPASEEEFGESSLAEATPDSKKSFQFLGDLRIKYDGLFVVASSVKPWRSPLFPLFGGKRAFLLLESGLVVKLKGSSDVKDFYARVKVAKKYFRSDDEVPAGKTDDLSSVPSRVQAVLNIPRRSALSVGARALTLVVFLGLVVVGMFFLPFFTMHYWSDWRDFTTSLTPVGVAYFTAEVFPYWLFVSNYFAEY